MVFTMLTQKNKIDLKIKQNKKTQRIQDQSPFSMSYLSTTSIQGIGPIEWSMCPEIRLSIFSVTRTQGSGV